MHAATTRLSGALLSCFLFCLLTACGNSQITQSFVDPELKQLDVDGVLVIAVTRQQKARTDFEDAFARALQRYGVRAEVSHSLLSSGEASADDIVAAASAAGLDAILVTRYIGKSSEEVYHPGTIYYDVAPGYGSGYYGGFNTYYGHAYEVAYEQPVWTTNVTHTLVSDLYLTANRKHMWQAVSETIQASGDRKLRNDAIGGLIGDLKSKGLLN